MQSLHRIKKKNITFHSCPLPLSLSKHLKPPQPIPISSFKDELLICNFTEKKKKKTEIGEMRKSFKDSLKALEANIYFTNTLKGFQFHIGIVSTKTTIFFYSLIALSMHQCSYFKRLQCNVAGKPAVVRVKVLARWRDQGTITYIFTRKVHQVGLRGEKIDVVVKVQHPGIRDLMMTDIYNLQAFALYIQKNDVKFDLFSVTK
ncbi:hypothetical protein PVK06_019834 [Gossypium arboreum]|uniref:ABC1 atypical kinase-like domain-containing protein n=1 Tax=Gossypium arboreum TaxID=29729 RepID=A0ABR0PKW2_GOSAR|nr:hypothetical protein PVK06_019834 [Gossypium arboreum]